MANGPKFKVLHEFKAVNGADCRIVTEDEKVPTMIRGESWNKKRQEWQMWLQSSEAKVISDALEATAAIEAEREDFKSQIKALKEEITALKNPSGP